MLLTVTARGGVSPVGPSGSGSAPGGSGSGAGGTSGGSGAAALIKGTLSTTVDGLPYNPNLKVTASNTMPPIPGEMGLFTVEAMDFPGQVTLTFGASYRGTLPMGTLTPPVAVFNIVDGPRVWAWSSDRGGSGSLTLTSVTATQVAGTFSFTAAADPTTGARGVRTVTNGRFDIAF